MPKGKMHNTKDGRRYKKGQNTTCNCGKAFTSSYRMRSYCSRECRLYYENRRHTAARRARNYQPATKGPVWGIDGLESHEAQITVDILRGLGR